jgi:hypothetical protein
LAADYFLIVLVELYRATSVKQLDDNGLDVAAMMKDGITKKRFLSKNEINIALHNIDMGNGDRQKITERIKKIKSWDVDNFLIQVMDCWYDSHHERLMQTEQVFFDSDENDDGELTLDEFMVAVRVMEPHCPKHDVIDLYDQIAGDDGVIDAEEFAQGVMLLHSHMIQHQRRIREDRRAAQIKDSSARKLKKAHGEQEQHQEHQEHQHFSLSHNNSSDKGLQQEELMYPHPPLEEKQKRGGGGRVGLGVGF